MPVSLMPDVEYVLYEWLSAQPEVSDLVADRIYKAALPPDVVWPAVRLTRITGDSIIPYPAVYDESRVQIDVWGEQQRQANRIAETIRSVITLRLNNYNHAEGVIKTADPQPPIYQPDVDATTSKGNPRPRYIVDVVITTTQARVAIP